MLKRKKPNNSQITAEKIIASIDSIADVPVFEMFQHWNFKDCGASFHRATLKCEYHIMHGKMIIKESYAPKRGKSSAVFYFQNEPAIFKTLDELAKHYNFKWKT